MQYQRQVWNSSCLNRNLGNSKDKSFGEVSLSRQDSTALQDQWRSSDTQYNAKWEASVPKPPHRAKHNQDMAEHQLRMGLLFNLAWRDHAWSRFHGAGLRLKCPLGHQLVYCNTSHRDLLPNIAWPRRECYKVLQIGRRTLKECHSNDSFCENLQLGRQLVGNAWKRLRVAPCGAAEPGRRRKCLQISFGRHQCSVQRALQQQQQGERTRSA